MPWNTVRMSKVVPVLRDADTESRDTDTEKISFVRVSVCWTMEVYDKEMYCLFIGRICVLLKGRDTLEVLRRRDPTQLSPTQNRWRI